MRLFFANQGIKFKIIAGYTLIYFSISIPCGFIVYSKIRKTITQNIQNELNNTTAVVLNMVKTAANVSIKNHLRAVCEKTRQNVEHIYQRYKAGQITQQSAKDEARRLIFSQTIGSTGYIYCVNSRGIPIEHNNPLIAKKDKWAKMPFTKEMIKRKRGYLEYEWKNPGEDAYRPKVVYMDYFKPWDWIISVSTYREELKTLINVDDFKESILSVKIGKTGYSFILDGNGTFIVHPKLKHNYFDDEDADKKKLFQQMMQLKSGTITYWWKNPGEKKVAKK